MEFTAETMETTVLLKGSGEKLLAHAEEWKHRQNLELVEVTPKEDIFARLRKQGVVWKKGIPMFPVKEGYIPPTMEQVKAWMDDEDE